MPYHIVLPRALNAEELAAEQPGGTRPRVGVAMLAKQLGGTIHAPSGEAATWADRARARVAGPPAIWAMARSVADQTGPDDVVFCSSEAGGLQVAEACAAGGRKPKICMFVHNLDRPRGRLALKLFRVAQRVDLLLACSSLQADFLREHLGLRESRVKFVWDHTDSSFFTPGLAERGKARPLIVSVGLEKRDYITLAAATSTMDVDVKISGFSEDAAAMAQTFPSAMPANMSRRFYAWPELVQLYRNADVIVVSVHENRYAAGVQSLMEAMACARPVVVTASAGLASYLDADSMLSVPPGNATAMRAAIERTLADRTAANRRAEKGHALATRRHTIERYVDEVASHLRALKVAALS